MAEPKVEESNPGAEFFAWIEGSWIRIAMFYSTLFIITSWLAVWFLLPRFYKDRAEVGQVGDSFGLVTSLFSGFTLLGAGYAVYAQHEQLSIARKQNEDARLERDETLKILTRQTEALLAAAKLQAVGSIGQMDNVLFQCLMLPPSITMGLSLQGDLKRLRRTRQYAEILLNDFETPDFDWGYIVPVAKREPLRKFYLTTVRRARLALNRSKQIDDLVRAQQVDDLAYNLTPFLRRLLDELELLRDQANGDELNVTIQVARDLIDSAINALARVPGMPELSIPDMLAVAIVAVEKLEGLMFFS